MGEEFMYLLKHCKLCNGKGYVFNNNRSYRGEVENLDTNVAKECECLQKVKLYRRYKKSNLLTNYYGFDFKKDFITEGPVKKSILGIVDNLEEFKEMGYGLLLHGGKGTGKTMIGTEILKSAIRNGYSAHYDFFPSIIDVFAQRGFEADKAKYAYEKKIASVDFLLLDELGKEVDNHKNFTRSDISRFLEINVLKKRSNKSTILISNLEGGVDGFQREYGQFVASVIKSKLHPLNLEGMDFREIEKANVEKFIGDMNGKS
jgi:DNA replication protein DnaC